MTTKAQELKKKKKKWIPILAGKEFNNQEIGETYLEEPEQALGRFVEANLMMLTRDSKKQNFNVKFKISEVKNNQAYAELIGYSMQVAQLKRTTKKGKNKVDDSMGYKTKDDVNIVIKPILISKALTYKTTLKMLRQHTRGFLVNYTKNNTYANIMRDIVNGNLQKDIKGSLKKYYPVTSCIIKDAHKLK